MSKYFNFKKVNVQKSPRLTPVVVYFATFGIGFLSYLVGRIALGTFSHPVHWASGAIGAVIGYFAGWAWYRWRGDIV